MSKRVTIIEKKATSGTARVVVHYQKKNNVEYMAYRVVGWKEDGRRMRKNFKTEAEADAHALSINMNLKNEGEAKNLKLTSLDDSQLQQSEKAFKALGAAYSLDEATEFFLRHHRPPEFTTSMKDGIKVYLDGKEHDGVRAISRKRTAGILRKFVEFANNPQVHTVAEPLVKSYLASLRAVDGVSPAKRKTWNMHRNELASFFIWARKTDLASNRPWTFNTPLKHIEAFSNKRVAEERPPIAVTSPEQVKELFTYLMNYHDGRAVKWFALAYFAGIRPSVDAGELLKLSMREDELINLKTRTIHLPADITKTKDSRKIKISDNLMEWLTAYEHLPLRPSSIRKDTATTRSEFDLQKDETRHSFISYHVALHRSIGDAALQAGNSETMIKRHYLDHCPQEEGQDFFSIVPDMEAGKAVLSEITSTEEETFKVI
jgi:hypothetical protein